MGLSPKVVIVEKPGLRVAGLSRGLIMISLAVDTVVRDRRVKGCPKKITWTAGSNGRHSAKGPHYMPRCEAGDYRSKDFVDTQIPSSGARVPAVRTAAEHKRHFLVEVAKELNDGPILRKWENDTKVVTAHYFLWLEKEGKSAEHFHFQVRKGKTIR